MGSKGDAYNNAVAESFFATLKKELIHRQSWPTDASLAPRSSSTSRRSITATADTPPSGCTHPPSTRSSSTLRTNQETDRQRPSVKRCRLKRGKSTAGLGGSRLTLKRVIWSPGRSSCSSARSTSVAGMSVADRRLRGDARRAGLLVAASLLGAMLWWRRHPSACPYSQRFWLEPPHPLITRTRLREILEPQLGERVLEIGPGTGYYTLPLAEWIGPDGRLDILDVQRAMLDDTMRRARERGLQNITPTCADAQHLPYPDGTFDAVVLVTTLGEIPDQDAAWREMARVLKPAGRNRQRRALRRPPLGESEQPSSARPRPAFLATAGSVPRRGTSAATPTPDAGRSPPPGRSARTGRSECRFSEKESSAPSSGALVHRTISERLGKRASGAKLTGRSQARTTQAPFP